MKTFEQGFADTERAATAAVKAAKNLLSIAKQMEKAAQLGNIASLRRIAERLENSSAATRQEISNLRSAWPFSPEDEEDYLKQSYEEELLAVAGEEQLKMSRRDDRLICYPSIIRVLPSDKAVRIDRKRVPNIRPTKLVALLKDNQQKPNKFRSETFLESLYRVYQTLADTSQQQRMLVGENRVGPVVQLSRVYALFTSLPRSSTEYGQTDFARDLYFLDSSGVNKVRSGATVSFPASTGTRNARGTFSFVSPEGEVVTYYGIQFTGGGS